jgi:predicted pyridoxine 5'-phosphate oxidase superfamily flavin-nucleotide-binding protein
VTHNFADLMFTPQVQAVQQQLGSRAAYARFAAADTAGDDRLTDAERNFIAARDSFYIATVSETGWPYVQHRGGPAGFLRVINDRTIGFADFRGNRQYVTVGNLVGDDRVALFLVDYPNRRRLKLLGRARAIAADSDANLLAPLRDGYHAEAERGLIVTIEAFDWNCPQHITPRYTERELETALAPFRAKLRALQAENRALRAKIEHPSS